MFHDCIIGDPTTPPTKLGAPDNSIVEPESISCTCTLYASISLPGACSMIN